MNLNYRQEDNEHNITELGCGLYANSGIKVPSLEQNHFYKHKSHGQPRSQARCDGLAISRYFVSISRARRPVPHASSGPSRGAMAGKYTV